MLNEETKRKLRLMNIGEFIEAIEMQSHDQQTLLRFAASGGR